MTEGQLVRNIVAYLKKRFGKDVVIFKHNDRITAGIPDLSVTRQFRTTWLEAKWFSSKHPKPSEVKKKLTPLQRETVKRLERVGRAYYIAGYPDEDGRPRFTVTNAEFVSEFWKYTFKDSSSLQGDAEQLLRFV